MSSSSRNDCPYATDYDAKKRPTAKGTILMGGLLKNGCDKNGCDFRTPVLSRC